MATTTTSELADSVVASHLQTEFMVAAAAQERWDQFSWVPENGAIAPASSETASTIGIIVYHNLDLITSGIAEATDIEGVLAADSTINVAVTEYGNAVQDTKRLRALARTDIPAALQEVIGRNAGLSQDLLARNAYVGGTLVRRPTQSDTRAQLDLTNDDLQAAGYTFFHSLKAQLQMAKAPGVGQASEKVGRTQGASEPGTEYVAVVSDLVIADLMESGGATALGLMQTPMSEKIFNGEIGRLAGIRIIESPLGKVYQSAGTIAQTATTSSEAIVAGATTALVTTTTGIVAGDYVSFGALETGVTDTSTLETVLVTSVTAASTGPITFIGSGPAGGTRFAHANGVAVTEATFVAAIPVFGGMSVAKVYSTAYGPKPAMTKTGPFDKLGRFLNYGWLWLGGYGRTIPTWLVRGE